MRVHVSRNATRIRAATACCQPMSRYGTNSAFTLHSSLQGRKATTMSDSMHFDIPVQQRVRPMRREHVAGRSGERAERDVAEPVNVYHWAAVALVTALMCAVLACAAGTPALSKAATVTSMVF